MKNFLEKYNATKLETTKDESQLSLDAYKQRILKLLDENMVHFKNNYTIRMWLKMVLKKLRPLKSARDIG